MTIWKFLRAVPAFFLSTFIPSSPFRLRRNLISFPLYASLFLLLTGCLMFKGNLPAAEAASTNAALSSISCGEPTVTGAGNDPCEVVLTAAAPSGFKVQIASNNSSATFPVSSLTFTAGTSVYWFHVTTQAVTTQKTVTLTASEGGVSKTFALTLKPAAVTTQPVTVSTLSAGASSIAFGDVSLNTASTQSLTLSSTGSKAVVISSLAATGTGYSTSGISLPLTIEPGKSATVDVEFDPKQSGAVSGKLTIASDSSAGASTAISLSGTGVAASSSYRVSLSWIAPAESELQITGYRVYRAAKGAPYQLLNASLEGSTSYVDSDVESGTAYDYYVESVDSAGASSAPSSVIALSIP